jgi:hypothetical protein
MVTVINPVSHSEAIKQNWKLLHAINIIALTTAIPMWFVTPFLTRNPELNSWHRFFRFSSISYAIVVGSSSLYCSNKLGKIKPKIDAMNKREIAEFKHTIASDLFLAQGTNSAIAQFILTERSTSLTSQDGSYPEVTLEGDTTVLGSKTSVSGSSTEVTTSITSVSGSQAEVTLSQEAQDFFEAVIDGLEDGYTDTQIIEQLMGFKGRSYKKGKTILAEIKKALELMENE